ncbi:MAG: hypothetical protein JWM41_1716 [Gemmatimonadetes bacterium]|nr:hypothetical protein [Gemmatimonadota bacterium]
MPWQETTPMEERLQFVRDDVTDDETDDGIWAIHFNFGSPRPPQIYIDDPQACSKALAPADTSRLISFQSLR